jgi:ABC-type Fe3+ transport system permease subunit
MRFSKKKLLGMFLLVVFFLSFFMLEFNFAQQVQQEEQEEKIIPSPQNIKESTGIYVFAAWMWIAIFVLIYILRLKIREVDRLLQIRFLSAKKK